jgi:hypothetical protein
VLAQPVNIAGTYTFTFVADGTCAGVPDAVRTRTYTATVTPHPAARTANTSYHVALGGAAFVDGFDGFPIGVAGDYVAFSLHGGHDAPVVEQVATDSYVAISGIAAASVGTSPVTTISVDFEGWVEHWTRPPVPGSNLASAHCESAAHRLVMTRR